MKTDYTTYRRQVDQMYSGMRNTVWVCGAARICQDKSLAIQTDANINHMIPLTIKPSIAVPNWVRDGILLKIHGYLVGAGRDEISNVPKLGVVVSEFLHPELLDLDPSAALEWNKNLTLPEEERDDMKLKTLNFSRQANSALIAGFVAGIFLEPPGEMRHDGKVSKGCLTFNIRQSSEEDNLIPVRCPPGPSSVAVYNRIRLGMPMVIRGHVSMRIKNLTNVPPNSDGSQPVHRYMYLHANKLESATPADIAETPEWVRSLIKPGYAKNEVGKFHDKMPSEYKVNPVRVDETVATVQLRKGIIMPLSTR